MGNSTQSLGRINPDEKKHKGQTWFTVHHGPDVNHLQLLPPQSNFILCCSVMLYCKKTDCCYRVVFVLQDQGVQVFILMPELHCYVGVEASRAELKTTLTAAHKVTNR